MVCLKDVLNGRWRSKSKLVCKDCQKGYQGEPNQWERCPECTGRLLNRIEAAKRDPRLLRTA